ncbi:glycosyltransferase [Flavobacterium sp.]|uniref:glycosyltransferase n=1 Tax=Flavobacterium sp. TaxID=239 RepID=UPI00286C7D26|nr:glycosyltransferase [Flavobacterium sp.]
MKILQVINNLATGGAEKLLLETIPLYREKGIVMDVLVLNGTNYPFLQQLKDLECCTIYSLGLKSVYNPIHIFKIIPYLKKYDILHVHLFPAQYWVVLAKLLSFSKTKLFFTEHNITNVRIQNKVFKLLECFIYCYYHKIICITNEIKIVMKQHTNSTSDKFVVIENGVNLAAIRASKPYQKIQIHPSINQDTILLIQVAGFREQKDQPTLIKALSHLPIEYKLLLVGDGVLQSDCEKLVQELQLSERVLFLGLRADVPQLLKTADIVVLSSHYEGLSLSSIEGMASGKPFVASKVAGLSEVVSGVGILFEQGNDKALAQVLENLIDNPDYYLAVAIACQEKANQYDISTMVDQHIHLYEAI